MTTTSTDLVQQYLDIWNERDRAARDTAIVAVMTEDSTYSDPDYAAVHGHAALSDVIGTAHEKFGDLVFTLGETLGSHHDTTLITWRLGAPGSAEAVATGYDVIDFAGDRIRRVVGYF
ncbi:nuclear transport factor 2 family protein [Pseudonocardia sp. CA-107938]|uniref:nuclear transport factor 2 family protein n=1 Tax=Pseudonocardia sp. CA-107938 TaxID=3240021 RepID=UPI003D8E34DB